MNFDFDERLSDSPLVERVWRTQSERGGSFISRAASQLEIVVTRQYGRSWITVRGPETRASDAPVPEHAEFFGIQFKLGSYVTFLPTSRLVDGAISLPEATTRSFWLHGAAWQFPDFDDADAFVSRLIHEGLLLREPVVEAVLDGHRPYMSARTVQRRFLHATGLTYKAIQQIERARQAAALLERGVPILDVVHETGYFDQAHMTNSLKRFIGQTPAQFLQLGRAA